MKPIHVRSPAKINLTLRVFPRAEDGFHPVESLVAQVGLFDDIEIAPQPPGVWLLECDVAGVPTDATNLVTRAARALALAAGPDDRRVGAAVQLGKRIPPGAGLGGGSSNAAAVLVALNRLWQCGMTTAQLAAIGASVGSDVALFLGSPVGIATGRGERVEPVESLPPTFAAIVLPDVMCPTAAVYAEFDRLPPPEPPALSVRQTHARAQRGEPLMPLCFNDLEPAALRVRPALGELSHALREACGGVVRMSGSGSAFFRLFGDEPGAREFAERVVSDLACRVEVAPLLR